MTLVNDAQVPLEEICAERAVLGALLVGQGAMSEASRLIEPNDFYHPAHVSIFGAMLTLHEQDDPIDEITVSAQLKVENQLGSTGGEAYLLGLTERVPTTVNYPYFLRTIRNRSLMRRLQNNSNLFEGHQPEGETIVGKPHATQFAVLCPWHEEKTPSCIVDLFNGRFYCFSCSAKGDAKLTLRKEPADAVEKSE